MTLGVSEAARKTGVKTRLKRVSKLLTDQRRPSGADLEACLVRAKLRAASDGRTAVTTEDLSEVFSDFVPATDALAVELQTLAAVLECTSRSMIPEEFQGLEAALLSARLNELKALLD